ncbi:MAG: hypothetical protein NVSMB58_37500 [Terriglobales bacterium]
MASWRLLKYVKKAKDAVSSSIEGYLDTVSGSQISGWAYDSSNPARRLLIELSSDEHRTIVIANIDREDLRQVGKGDGKYGFVADLNTGSKYSGVVRAKVLHSGFELEGSPWSNDIVSRIRNAKESGKLLKMLSAEAGLACDLPRHDLPTGLPSAKPYPTRAAVQTLFDAISTDLDPQGIISRYTEYEFHRLRVDSTYRLDGEVSDRLNVLYWYLAGYSGRRCGVQVPLSKKQIEYLNSSIPIVEMDSALTIAAYSFILKEFPGGDNFHDESWLREALYWWCIQRSPQIARGGELVSSAQVGKLRFTLDEPDRFPLNYFVRRTHALDPAFSMQLNLDLESDRAILLCILVLRCSRKPELARYLPRASISELLKSDVASGGGTTFESILGLSKSIVESKELLESVEHLVEKAGFSLRRNISGMHRHENVGTCLVEDPAIGSGLVNGVAVIGPTRATSGLGQATRLSIEVLEYAGYNVATVDFGMDNPAPIGFASDVKGSKLRNPHAINLIHLNAESTPLAFAYLTTSIYEKSYNIGFFFWELDRLPKCHYLALDMLDEIWVSSEYNRDTYQRSSGVPVINVGMAVEPLPEALAAVSFSRFGISDADFVFLTTFDSFSFIERKNPLAAIETFTRAFPTASEARVRLLIKTQNRERVRDSHQLRIWQQIDRAVEQDGRIHVIDETLSYRELLGLKKICHCYVSLHRAEGWGFGMIEAMQLGVPVIATGYSGNMEFCTNETCFLVEYTMTSPYPGEYIFVERGSQWAEPKISSAVEHMRTVFTNRPLASARAAAASELIDKKFSVAATAERYRARLLEIAGIIARSRGPSGRQPAGSPAHESP